MLIADGWYQHSKRGSHRQFKHKTKKGRVTVNGKERDTLSQELLNSIWKPSGVAISHPHNRKQYGKNYSKLGLCG